jgi:hypothetical protein
MTVSLIRHAKIFGSQYANSFVTLQTTIIWRWLLDLGNLWNLGVKGRTCMLLPPIYYSKFHSRAGNRSFKNEGLKNNAMTANKIN